MDPFEKLDLKGDTTFALALEAQARKHEISFFKPDDLFLKSGKVFANICKIELSSQNETHNYRYHDRKTSSLTTKIFVNSGSVLLTGKVKNPSEKIELTKISWTIKGVNEVNNELQITDTSSIKNVARDIASMGEIRARIMTDKAINSINFSIDVVNDKAYISGVASSKEEMLLVKNHVSSARFVKEVYNYIILFDDKR